MKRKFWQFRLRSLFVLLLLCAFAAAWWSHRRHCLEMAEFHERHAKSDIDGAATAEYQAMRANFEHSVKMMNEQLELAMEQSKKARQKFHEAMNDVRTSVPEAMLLDAAMQQRSAHRDFFDETIPERTRIERAISSGYLLAHVADGPRPRSNPSTPTPQQPEPTVTVEETSEPPPPAVAPSPQKITPPSPEQMALERRANALHERSEFHKQQQELYLRAVYRPWMKLQEPPTPKVPAEPKP